MLRWRSDELDLWQGEAALHDLAVRSARRRFVTLLVLTFVALGCAYLGIELGGDVRLTIFQPFRLATVARGLCLVALAGHVAALIQQEGAFGKARAVLLAAGLTGDWPLIAATATELTAILAQHLRPRLDVSAGLVAFTASLAIVAWRDPLKGHTTVLGAPAGATAVAAYLRHTSARLSWGRLARALACAWLVPGLAWLACQCGGPSGAAIGPLRDALLVHCRFTAQPVNEVERLASWCNAHTPDTARFIAPPGAKSFRLWSARAVAFSRAGSPYHAAGLADWYHRFRDHVGFEASTSEFVREFLQNPPALERRYEAHDHAALARLATRQGASHVVAAPSSSPRPADDDPLELLHVEGRYAVYRVRPVALASAGTG